MSESAETIGQLELLKRTLTALGIHVSIDHLWTGRDVLTIWDGDGEEIQFSFDVDGKFEDVNVWKA